MARQPCSSTCFSKKSLSKSAKAPNTLALIPLGGSLVNFTEFCKTLIGKALVGMDDKKSRKSTCAFVSPKVILRTMVSICGIQEEVFQSLIKNLVPNLWAKKSFLYIKPLPAYIADFQRRIDFIYNWARVGPPQSYWISGFFFPQSFLTGLLQTHARKRVLPIDSLKIDFQVLDRVLVQQDFFELHQQKKSDVHLYGDMPQSTEAGVNVHGFFIEAAHWDASKGGLIDALPGELYFRMPAIRFVPCLSVQAGQRYEAPCYKTQQRSGVLSTTGHSTNFVVSVLLESKLQPDFWILRGTALVSAVSDNIS